MKKLTTAKIWQFAAGQFGWAMLSGIISNWLVYFYQPDKTAISQGQTVFIPQGLVVLGIFTIIGGITAFGRIFDAFTDPMIASWSDRCTSKNGRRIPFLKWASLPLALSTVLVFWSPVNKNSWINAVFLLVMILAYYLSITAYCTPYNALIPELGHTQQERLNSSTVISFPFIAIIISPALRPASSAGPPSITCNIFIPLSFSSLVIYIPTPQYEPAALSPIFLNSSSVKKQLNPSIDSNLSSVPPV